MSEAPATRGKNAYNATIPGADTLIRLHLSESPYGASPSAVQAAERELRRINLYPAPERDALVAALSAHWAISPDRIAVANGSDELVLATALTLGDRGRPGLVHAGTFPGYPASLNRIGRSHTAVPLVGTGMDVGGFADRLPDHGIGYVCNPHNPSGSVLSADDLTTLVKASEAGGVPLVFDEAYMDFADPGTPQARDWLDRGAPIVVLRTFSKAYGLASLRIGYALGAPELIAELKETLRTLPFSVNRIAQAAATSALGDSEFLERTRRANESQRAWFTGELDRLGRGHLPSSTNFVAVQVRDPSLAQDRLAAEHGILVRSAALFGFPGYLRVSLGTRDELTSLLDALDSVDPLG
ncbi:pyridoxal phosphate-dependent aminotransferase [Streptomyces sp. DT24]|uniref:pyridoxal phosphate-dependent aminotransferase n=1 Tax=unclassified Streptomyces TaxID=2593676 RepID=UPI0023B90A9D|nr:histidinol-phosphate transaminase [Streptomyces sp. AM 4-1-1]WEH35113.1 histidinol-phosphate transaminase [Streptomyces sp. AM 4-1-1]